MNVFGEKWSFTSFGESHGAAIGGVLDGVPAGLKIDFAMIREELDRRAGRGAAGVSARAVHEPDKVEGLSGVMDGVTLGTPIAFIIRNKDARPEDYEYLKHTYRVGHECPRHAGIRNFRQQILSLSSTLRLRLVIFVDFAAYGGFHHSFPVVALRF